MDDAIWIKLIEQVPYILGALGIFIGGLVTSLLAIMSFIRQGKAITIQNTQLALQHAAGEERKTLTDTVDKLAVGINGQSAQLQKVTRALGFTEGEQAQKDVQATKDSSFAAGIKDEKERQG